MSSDIIFIIGAFLFAIGLSSDISISEELTRWPNILIILWGLGYMVYAIRKVGK